MDVTERGTGTGCKRTESEKVCEAKKREGRQGIFSPYSSVLGLFSSSLWSKADRRAILLLLSAHTLAGLKPLRIGTQHFWLLFLPD